jgi:glucose/arabinose dehydrogenase
MHDILRATALAGLLASLTPALAAAQSLPSESSRAAIAADPRLAWDQEAPNAEELGQYSFVLLVDGVPEVLWDAACGALAGEPPRATCFSPFPDLSPGQHTLQLATRLTRDGMVLESALSAPLLVTIAGSSPTRSAVRSAPTRELPGPDGIRYLVERVVSGLDRPSALAKLPDGRLLIAERRGRIRIADAGRLLDAPAVELADAITEDDEGLSLAVAPDFAATRHVYVSYAARDAEGSRVGRVVRFREVGGVLGERAVILDGLPAEAGAPRAKFGPDGALYVGTAALDSKEAGDLGSYSGKLLRFTADGMTPPDNPIRFSPVFTLGHRGRLDFDWEPLTRSLWDVETDGGGVTLGRANSERQRARAAYLEGIQAAGVAFHAGATPAAWRNSLFLASPDQECLYRVAGLSSTASGVVVERLLARRYGRIVAVFSGDDGLYFATGNGGTDAPGRPTDAVFRIREP